MAANTPNTPPVRQAASTAMSGHLGGQHAGGNSDIGSSVINSVANGANDVNHLVAGTVKRIGAVAREARDIPTAIGTLAKANPAQRPKAYANLGRQAEDVVNAARTGNRQTGSDLVVNKAPVSAKQIIDPTAKKSSKYVPGTVFVPSSPMPKKK